MPLYEYRCGACSHEVEVLQKLSDPAPVECPACHAPALQKKLSAAGFQLKGTGWYVTDFRGGDKPRPEAAGKAGESGSGTAAAPAAGAASADKPAGESGAGSVAPASGGSASSAAATPAAVPSAG